MNAKPHTKLTDSCSTRLWDVRVILESRHEINRVSGIINEAGHKDAQKITIKDIWVYDFSESSIANCVILFQAYLVAPITYCQLIRYLKKDIHHVIGD